MTPAEFRTTLERLGLTQGQAAEALGLDIRTINRYANGAEIPKAIELALEALTLVWEAHPGNATWPAGGITHGFEIGDTPKRAGPQGRSPRK